MTIVLVLEIRGKPIVAHVADERCPIAADVPNKVPMTASWFHQTRPHRAKLAHGWALQAPKTDQSEIGCGCGRTVQSAFQTVRAFDRQQDETGHDHPVAPAFVHLLSCGFPFTLDYPAFIRAPNETLALQYRRGPTRCFQSPIRLIGN